jgi:putative cell wall-binding protein
LSQSHLLKFGIIPVILTIAAAVTVQRLTTANVENTGQQNVPITKVFSNLTTENSAKSQTETAITQASEKISAAKNNSANETPELFSAEISAEKKQFHQFNEPRRKVIRIEIRNKRCCG